MHCIDDARTADETPAYYPPVADWNFAGPSVLAEYDASLSSPGQANFLRSAEWSPDGTAILTTAEDRVVRVFDLPWETLSPLLTPSLELPLQGPLYSALWYPLAHRGEPSGWCFLYACDTMPVKLVNATNGALQGTYSIIDHQERFVAPHSMAFSTDYASLYCGFLSAIEIFNLAAPGSEGERIKTTSTKASRAGQKGIVSALAFCPDGSGMYIAGSYEGSAWVYDGKHQQVGALKGVDGRGITHIEFHPIYPQVVYLSSRRSPYLVQAFDLTTRRLIANFPRSTPGKTSNQKTRFSLDRWGRYLVVGDEEGRVGFYDVSRDGEGEGVKGPVEDRWLGYVLQAGQDAISSAVVHPFLPILATVSGSRHEPPAVESDSDDSSSSSNSESEAEMVGQTRRPTRTLPKPKEAKLRIWSFTPPSLGTETPVAPPPGEKTAFEREPTGGDQAAEVPDTEKAGGLAVNDAEEEEAQLNG